MSDVQPEYPDADPPMDINVLAIVKGTERYIFLFTDEKRAECLRVLDRYASDPELSFTWYDVAVLSQKIRKIVPQEPAPVMSDKHQDQVAEEAARRSRINMPGFHPPQ